MKKVLFIGFFVGIVLFGALAFGQEKAEQEVAIQEGNPYEIAIMEFSGSYEQMPQKINLFMGEFFKQKLRPGGPLHGIYFNMPQQGKPGEQKWAVGFPVPKDSAIQTPLKKWKFEHKTIAVYTYIGPYEKIEPAYEKILKYIERKGYKMALPAYDKYLNNPGQVKPEELKTIIMIPIVKK